MKRRSTENLRRIASIAAIVAILVSAMLGSVIIQPTTPVFAATTSGPRDAGTGTNVTGIGTVAWPNPNNVISNNNVYASVSVAAGAITNYLQATNFGFSIPSDATINGIQVTIGRYNSGGTGSDIQDNVVSLVKAGSVTGNNKAVTGTDWPGSEGAATYGGAADLWGTTWTPADINSGNFGVALAVRNAHGSTTKTAYVDYMQITVTYTALRTITASAGAGGTISPSGTVSVDYGANQTFNIQPSCGYIVSDVLVDGISVGQVQSYTFTSVTSTHTIAASFSDTGWRCPTANVNSGWTNPQNAYTSNNQYATAGFSGDIVQYYNFNIPSIPSGATITGIEVAVEGYQSNWALNRQADVSISSNNGGTYTSVKTSSLPDSESTQILGSPTDTWGRTWSIGDFANANFRVRLDATFCLLCFPFNSILYVDHVKVRVHYTLPTTTTTVASSLNPSTYGALVTVTATVTRSAGVNTPTGTVTFKDGATTLGTSTLSGSGASATATYTTSSLAAGSHSITAVYGGDSNFLGSTSTVLTQTVNKATPTITWSNPADITYGTALSGTQLNAVASVPGTYVYTPPSGTVLSAGSGQTLLVNFTPTDTVNYSTTSKSVLINVTKSSTTTGLASSANPSEYRASVTFTATVSPTAATGTVQFNIDGLPFGSPVTLSGGSATSGATSSLSSGGHTITAVYIGDANYSTSTGMLTQTVSQQTIEITAPADISSWTASPASGGENTNSSTLGVNVTPDGTSWTVTAQDIDATTGGRMTQWSGSYGTAKLANAMRVQGPAGEVTLPVGGAIASDTGDTTVTITFKQKVEWTDAPGDYRIVVTFIGAVVP